MDFCGFSDTTAEAYAPCVPMGNHNPSVRKADLTNAEANRSQSLDLTRSQAIEQRIVKPMARLRRE